MSSLDQSNPDPNHPASAHAESVVALHLEQERRISPHQRAVENLTFWIGRPFLLYVAIGLSILWIGLNLLAPSLGFHRWDRPPFPALQSIWSLSALLVTIVVLVTQNRQVRTEQRQSHLALQLSLLSDQKTAKIIDLLEQLRRDMPQVPNRIDPEAEALKEVVSPELLANDLEKRLSEIDPREERSEVPED